MNRPPPGSGPSTHVPPPRHLWLLREPGDDDRGDSDVDVSPDQASTTAPERAIRCGRCDHQITRGALRITVDGSFGHTFVNPAGILFEIGCFSGADGCAPVGPESDEFSWFEGYTWQVVVCESCTSQLGWRFWSTDHSFFGLILPRLTGLED